MRSQHSERNLCEDKAKSSKSLEAEQEKRRMAAEDGQVIGVHTVDEWKERLEKGKDKLIVVDFTASWCGPCRFIAPILAEIAKKLPHVTFLKVDVDELKAVAEEWGVEAMPTFLFLKNGEVVDKVVGAKKEELQLTISKHDTAAAATATAAVSTA